MFPCMGYKFLECFLVQDVIVDHRFVLVTYANCHPLPPRWHGKLAKVDTKPETQPTTTSVT